MKQHTIDAFLALSRQYLQSTAPDAPNSSAARHVG